MLEFPKHINQTQTKNAIYWSKLFSINFITSSSQKHFNHLRIR